MLPLLPRSSLCSSQHASHASAAVCVLLRLSSVLQHANSCQSFPTTAAVPCFRITAQLPLALAEKIREQYRYMAKETSAFDSSGIVDAVPELSSTSLLYAQHRAITKSVGFLAKRPPTLVCALLRSMVPCFASVSQIWDTWHPFGPLRRIDRLALPLWALILHWQALGSRTCRSARLVRALKMAPVSSRSL